MTYRLTMILSVLPFVNNHLHHTSSIINRSYYDCLYTHYQLHSRNSIKAGSIDAQSFVPYCRRNLFLPKTEQNGYQGQRITFKDLRRENVTIDDLFVWQVSMNILNGYEKFLRSGNDQAFCNCSTTNRFGKNYESILNGWPSTSLETLITDCFRDGPKRMSETCYQGPLAKKSLNNHCLNWRQICNGIYNCEMGEDERLCLILGANVFQDNEYRCQNGLRITFSFSFYFIYDCLDRTDEPHELSNQRLSQTVEQIVFDYPIYT